MLTIATRCQADSDLLLSCGKDNRILVGGGGIVSIISIIVIIVIIIILFTPTTGVEP